MSEKIIDCIKSLNKKTFISRDLEQFYEHKSAIYRDLQRLMRYNYIKTTGKTIAGKSGYVRTFELVEWNNIAMVVINTFLNVVLYIEKD